MEDVIAACREALGKAGGGSVLALTGAGVSAESGIPTFRGKEGYWTVGARDYTLRSSRRDLRGVHSHAVGRVGLVPLPSRHLPGRRAERGPRGAGSLGRQPRRAIWPDHAKR